MNDKTLSIIVKAQDHASKTISNIGDVTARVGDAFVKMAKVAAVAGAAAAAAFTGNAIKSAIDLNESINAVQKTFGDASGKILEFGKVAADQAGLSMAQLNTAVTPIGAMLRNVGFGADQAADSSIELGKRAADLASVFNTSLDDALTAIQAGLRGEADPLERFGVGLSETNVKAYALAKGITATGKEMTVTEKATARLGLFLEQTNRFAGDFVGTADEAANKSRILQARFENQSAVIGQRLLPVWEGLLDVGDRLINNGFPLIDQGITFVTQKFNELWPAIQNVASQVGDYLGPKFSALWETIQTKLIPILNDLWKNVLEPLMPVLGTVLVAAIGLVVDALNFMISALDWLIRKFQEGNPIILALAGAFGVLAAAMAFSAIFSALNAGFAFLTAVTIPGVMTAVAGLAAFIAAPVVFGAIVVGAAIGALALVQNAANKAKAAIDEAMAASNKERETSVNLMKAARARFDKGEINESQLRNLVGIYARAKGGPVSANQPYLVGENKDGSINSTTELFVPGSSGSIMNSSDLQKALGNSGGGGTTFNMYGNVNLGSADAVNEYFNRINAQFNQQKELGNYGVGI